MGTGELTAGGNPIQGGVEILLVASCYGNHDKLRPDGPLGSYADLTFYFTIMIITIIQIRTRSNVSIKS